jgi:hypothetical protein
MAKVTIHQKANPFCLWCLSEKPATKTGWIKLPLGDTGYKAHFCSKKHLAAATVQGKGILLDACKLKARQRQNERKEEAAKFRELIKKDKLGKDDFGFFFNGLSAKQRKVLSYIGFGHLLGQCFCNPRKMLEKINE